MDNCIFCKIVEGDISSYKFYEDENFIAFLDINPKNLGHFLIVTKNHYENLLKVPDDIAKEILVLAKILVKNMQERLEFYDFKIVQNNGKLAGQEVMHYHLHIIPFYPKDAKLKFSKREFEKILSSVKEMF